MRLRTVALSLLPGAAHVDLGKAGRGLLLFVLFAFLLNGALVAPLVTGAAGARTACVVLASGVWVAAFCDAMRVASREGA